jgi:hypothetical protein
MSTFITRSKEQVFTVENLSTNCEHTPPNHVPKVLSFSWPGYTSQFEAMTPNSSRDKQTWKSFHHYRRGVAPTAGVTSEAAVAVHVDTSPHDYDYIQSTQPYAVYCNEFGTAGVHSDGLPSWYDPTMEYGFVPDPDGLSGLKSRSLRTMLPQIRAELSLVNSLIELKDFKSLPRTQQMLGDFIRQLPRAWRNGQKTLRQLLRTSSDGYLQTQFNFLPLMSDLTGLTAALDKTRARINALVSGQGYTKKRHFRCDLPVNRSESSEQQFTLPLTTYGYEGNTSYQASAISSATRLVYTDVAVFHAEIVYNYNFTRYQVEHAQLLGMLDALGVNLNPAIIWNAIKWTFVVDWFIGVSRWLSDRAVLNMEPVTNIQNYLWSVSYRRRILVSRRLSRAIRQVDLGPTIYKTLPSISLPVVTETAYRRQVELPSVGSITSSGLSLKEFSLGAALVIANSSHHKRGGAR